MVDGGFVNVSGLFQLVMNHSNHTGEWHITSSLTHAVDRGVDTMHLCFDGAVYISGSEIIIVMSMKIEP